MLNIEPSYAEAPAGDARNIE